LLNKYNDYEQRTLSLILNIFFIWEPNPGNELALTKNNLVPSNTSNLTKNKKTFRFPFLFPHRAPHWPPPCPTLLPSS
jgi:hypothetical protein